MLKERVAQDPATPLELTPRTRQYRTPSGSELVGTARRLVVDVENNVDEKEEVVDTCTVYLAAPPTRDQVSTGVLDEVADDGERPDGAAGAAEAGVADITEKTSAMTKLMGAAHLKRFPEFANT